MEDHLPDRGRPGAERDDRGLPLRSKADGGEGAGGDPPRQHIAEELEERGLSAAHLARAMGVDRGRVSRLINGRTAVTGETAILLSRVFGTSPELSVRLQGDYDLALAHEAMG